MIINFGLRIPPGIGAWLLFKCNYLFRISSFWNIRIYIFLTIINKYSRKKEVPNSSLVFPSETLFLEPLYFHSLQICSIKVLPTYAEKIRKWWASSDMYLCIAFIDFSSLYEVLLYLIFVFWNNLLLIIDFIPVP